MVCIISSCPSIRWDLVRLSRPRELGAWARIHLGFGFRGFLGGVFAEVNTRVAILMGGILLTSGYRTFTGIFLLAGRPATQTAFVGVTVLGNVVLIVLTIPWLGIRGAALATALVFVLEAMLVIVSARLLLRVKL